VNLKLYLPAIAVATKAQAKSLAAKKKAAVPTFKRDPSKTKLDKNRSQYAQTQQKYQYVRAEQAQRATSRPRSCRGGWWHRLRE
jgi:hypothetical protein